MYQTNDGRPAKVLCEFTVQPTMTSNPVQRLAVLITGSLGRGPNHQFVDYFNPETLFCLNGTGLHLIRQSDGVDNWE